jgi:hypothetical protein
MKRAFAKIVAPILACVLCVGFSPAHAESVYVKYRGEVDLSAFDCRDIARSSFIRRVCYDQRNAYMLISLNGTFYHYCAIDAGTVSSLLSAPSMGQFYNASIKGSFDCRVHQVPGYTLASPDPAAESETHCAVDLFGYCLSNYSREEEAEQEKVSALEAELSLRQHALFSNGELSIYHGILSTTFHDDEDIVVSILCSPDAGMEIVFRNNNNKRASVRVPMEEFVCDAIAKRIGDAATRITRRE